MRRMQLGRRFAPTSSTGAGCAHGLSRSLATSNQPPAAEAAAEAEPPLLVATVPGLRVVDFHRPHAMNAINPHMVQLLLPLVQDWQQDGGDVRMIVLRGSGQRAFCAGVDVQALHAAATGAVPLTAAHTFLKDELALQFAVGTSTVPVISILEGVAMGSGVGLSVHGQFRVATENTLCAFPETGLGFFPSGGGTHFLPRLRGALGTYLGLTGARLTGRDALEAGIATHFVRSARLPAVESILAEHGKKALMANEPLDPDVVSASLAAIDILDAELLQEQLGTGPSFLERHAAEIDHCFGQPTVEEIAAAVDESAGQNPMDPKHWAHGARKELALASPTSLRVTLEALRRGGELSTLRQCLEMEYQLAQQFIGRSGDLRGGLGAVLGTGPRPAAWAAAPTADEVEEYFVPGEPLGQLEHDG